MTVPYSIKAIALAVFFSCCATGVPKMQSTGQQRKVEFRLAEYQPDAELTEAVVPGSGYKVYLHKEVVATEKDVLAARVVGRDAEGFVEIVLIFGSDASKKMAAVTAAHLDKPLAILLDGNLVAAPQVRSTIQDSAAITGRFTKEEAETISKAIDFTSLLEQPLTDDQARVSVELRLAEKRPAKSLTEAVVRSSLAKVYLHKEVLISNADIVETRVVNGYKEGIFDIELVLTKEAGERIARASEAHLGKMLAVLINGRVVSAEFIIGRFSAPIDISGEFTEEEAHRIANALKTR